MTLGVVLAIAGCSLVVSLAFSFRKARVWLGSILVSALATLLAASWVLTQGGEWDWQPGFSLGGESVRLHLDGLSAFFLALVAFVGGTGALYARDYWPDVDHPRSARWNRCWWSLLLGAMGSVLLCANGLHFLMAWELFTLAGFFLITLDGRRQEVRAAGWLYLAASHAGTLALFAFFSLLAARTGGWALGPQPGATELAPLFWLALVGFGLKTGVFPLHIWLPTAHSSAPSHVSAILSGVAIKMGVYGLLRFSGWLPVPASAGWIVVGLGLLSAVLGVAFALGQRDLKRLLAYSSVENVGIILIGVGFAMLASASHHPAWGALALAGSLLHVWNHGLFKSLLFLGAGSVLHATGTREMSRLGGLWRSMPRTTLLFGFGALAISGLPPLNGFVSEWLVYTGLFDAAQPPGGAALAAIPAIILLAVTGALALACFVNVCSVVFLGAPRSDQARRGHECPGSMLTAMTVLAAASTAIGLAPMLFWPALQSAVGAWAGAWADAPMPLSLNAVGLIASTFTLSAVACGWMLWRRVRRGGLRRALTWDCGYAQPSSRMQYTAGSFTATLTQWFAPILRPVRVSRPTLGVFPGPTLEDQRIPETVLELGITPVARLVVSASHFARRLQQGRVQAYLFYLLLGLTGVALLALLWNG